MIGCLHSGKVEVRFGLMPQLDGFYCGKLQVHPQRENTLAVAAAKLNHEISLALQLFLFHRVESTLCISRGGNELNSLLLSSALQIIRYTQHVD